MTAQPDAGAHAVLKSIRERALENVRTLPNYTCTSVIERSARRSVSHRFENVDRIHLEIAYIGGSELFGWPAGERIGEQDLRRFVGGSITNGDFALLTRALFAGPGVTFQPAVRKDLGGRAVWSINFSSPREGSEWVLSLEQRDEPVAYSGSLQADPESLRLISIGMSADYIPREFGYRRVTRNLEFQPVKIGSNEVMLPSRAEFLTLDRNGEETRNEASFTGCREYTAESVLRFEEAEPEPVKPAATEAAGGLPDQFEASLELETPVDSDVSAIGDAVTMRLTRSIAGKSGVVVPKGAVLHGRIKLLSVQGGHRCAEFGFRYFEWDGKRVEITDRENRMVVTSRRISGSQSTGPGNWSPTLPTVEATADSVIRASGRRLVLARGFAMKLESKVKEH